MRMAGTTVTGTVAVVVVAVVVVVVVVVVDGRNLLFKGSIIIKVVKTRIGSGRSSPRDR